MGVVVTTHKGWCLKIMSRSTHSLLFSILMLGCFVEYYNVDIVSSHLSCTVTVVGMVRSLSAMTDDMRESKDHEILWLNESTSASTRAVTQIGPQHKSAKPQSESLFTVPQR